MRTDKAHQRRSGLREGFEARVRPERRFGGGARLREQECGDDRSVKIKSLEAAKNMKIKWLVLGLDWTGYRIILGCMEANFCN